MQIEEVKDAIEKNDIDRLITGAKYIEKGNAREAYELYNKYYEKEVMIAGDIQNILASIKNIKSKTKIPAEGTYVYRLGS
ncbi:hypothetical protein ENBRE01_2455 [Enteropsectra breve]|nr:hypothetical protein ENBRE01_2219 [Enteropsectra breve]KAI5151881.1 hypothetical protein ENBRE01_2455 [Enteropsectra breve]